MRKLLTTLMLVALCWSLAGCNQPSDDGLNHVTYNSGEAALDYLTAEPFTELVIEIDVAEGVEIDRGVTELLQQRVSELCRKPGGVQVTFGSIPAHELRGSYDVARLRELRRLYFQHPSAGTQAGMYILVLNGDYLDNTRAMGFVFESDAYALFNGAVQRMEPEPERWPMMQEAVLVHEMGHLLGLVGLGIPHAPSHTSVEHEDDYHPFHDADARCVMYWLIGRSSANPPTTFCDRCKADITAANGKLTPLSGVPAGGFEGIGE